METLLNIIIDIAAMLVTLGILVTFHEYGHFWVARKCGVRVERFSIGFGKPIFSWKRGDTEYVIAALPLGGYVKMLGEQDSDIEESEKHLAFNHKSLSQRAAIVSAGPLANFLLATLLYWLMFVTGVSGLAPVIGAIEANSPAEFAGIVSGDEIIAVDGETTQSWQEVNMELLSRLGETGTLALSLKRDGTTQITEAVINLDRWLIGESEPSPINSLGLTPFRLDIPASIGELTPGGRAETSGLQTDDLVTEVNNTAISGWLEWVDIIRANPEKDLRITVQRNGGLTELIIRPGINVNDEGENIGFIGAGVQEPEELPVLPEYMNREIHYSLLGAIPQAINETWRNTVFVLESIKKMVVGLISVENLSGPITIAQVAGQTASYGFEVYIGFLAILSISLGVLNLLPIPVLDGGHLLYYFIESIIRRPVPEKIQALGMQFGMLLIAGIMVIAFYNDLNRLF